MAKNAFFSIGLMSGTSLDGVDAALLFTDGAATPEIGPGIYHPYAPQFREGMRPFLGQEAIPAELENELTDAHYQAVEKLLQITGLKAAEIEVIGFHGQTLLHQPARKRTIQVGNAARLANGTRIPVIHQFRQADIQAGGQGAPLVPVFHRALAQNLPKPLAILNIGGVGNITYIGPQGELMAFDTGPGGALLDDWMRLKTGEPYDRDGAQARQGTADQSRLQQWLSAPFFRQPAPKSLDRNQFGMGDLSQLSIADGAATLVAFTVQAVRKGFDILPQNPRQLLVAGGGRKNRAFLEALRSALPCPVAPVESVNWDGDMLEAQAFAFLAARSVRNLPLTFPETTGVPSPQTGGIRVEPS